MFYPCGGEKVIDDGIIDDEHAMVGVVNVALRETPPHIVCSVE